MAFHEEVIKKLMAYLAAAAIIVCLCPFGLSGKAEEPPPSVPTVSAIMGYEAYLETYGCEPPYNGQPVAVAREDGDGIMEPGTTASFTVNAPLSALYILRLYYRPSGSGGQLQAAVTLDGETPYNELAGFLLPQWWQNAGEVTEDGKGNQIVPEQVPFDGVSEYDLSDSLGVETQPYQVFFTAGTHSIDVLAVEGPFILEKLELRAPENPAPYNEVKQTYKTLSGGAPICIQGEDAFLKTSAASIPKSDTSYAGMTPSSYDLTKLNYIGGTSWQEPGETLTWKFKVTESGLYQIGFKFRQSDSINWESWRKLKIDGEVPFKEAAELRFPYSHRWQFLSFSEKAEPYLLELEAGEHTLSLEATLGGLSEYYRRLEALTEGIGDEYIKMVMITGDTPDPNRDYDLFRQIPGFNDRLTEYKDGLLSLSEDMRKMMGEESSQLIAALKNMARITDEMLNNPFTAHTYIKSYYDTYNTVSAWLNDMKRMPLAIDEIQLIPAGGEFERTSVSFFEGLWFGTCRFFSSFFGDYNTTSDTEGGETLTLWVNWGRDQAMALDTLIRDSFTPESGISIKLELSNATLIQGLTAGRFPDVTLHMARSQPVNLGMRNALYDLSNFDDFEETLTRFQPDAEIPYRYNGGCYALPDTQTFFMMFYREDILSRMGLEIPKTWDEFMHAATVIQRNNLQVYVPHTDITAPTTVNAGAGSLNLFPSLMAQKGLSLYNDELTATAINSPEAAEVFKFFTGWYNEYGYVKTADFYNRFRVGTMPLGIAAYPTYLTLSQTAPEIRGRWSIAPIPAFENGEHISAGGGTGCGIVARSGNKKAAWEFLKWWTKAQTQTAYSGRVESILGLVGRQSTSTTEAFALLGWSSNDRCILEEQWRQVREIPEIPGSYYLVRALDQAYWAVLNGEARPEDALRTWSKAADEEIARKIKEYS